MSVIPSVVVDTDDLMIDENDDEGDDFDESDEAEKKDKDEEY